MDTVADLRAGQAILYKGKPCRVVDIRSVKAAVHKRLFFLELVDEAGERVSLTAREGAVFALASP